MSELESLTSSSTVGAGRGSKSTKHDDASLLAHAVASLCLNPQAKRKGACVLAVVVALAFCWIWNASSTSNSSSAVVVDSSNEDFNPINETTTMTTPSPSSSMSTTATTTPPESVLKKTDWSLPQLPLDPYSNTHLDDNMTRDQLTTTWGQWHFWDDRESQRPSRDYLQQFPNHDVVGSEFPSLAWQVDAVYVNHFLNDADQLVSRAMEAIYQEYGHGKPLSPAGMMERMTMFHWDVVDLEKNENNDYKTQGGWTTQRSMNGLVRRLLHAMITQDTFTVVLAGHSSAAGAGNHFRQSYLMQFHKIMFPIFARLGVKLITRNISQGGSGFPFSVMPESQSTKSISVP